MNQPTTNYLRNTAPELRPRFVELLGELELFQGLAPGLKERIFDYAKFVALTNGERPVVEGMFDQEIYVLVRGGLEVFISLGPNQEKQIDSLSEPFTLFGERCILGQPRGASIQASGDTLLLGLDLSSLPDLLDGIEDPARRLEDAAYAQNLDMYLVVAQVLFGRLERLIYDQHKLLYKARGMLKSASLHKKAVLTTQLFNEWVEDRLHPALLKPEIWRRLLRDLGTEVDPVCYAGNQAHSRRIYQELVAQQALGHLEGEEWLYQILRRLREQALYLKPYTAALSLGAEQLPQVMQMAQCLEQLHQKLQAQASLRAPLPLEGLLQAVDVQGLWSPSQLVERLAEDRLVEGYFEQAHLALVICEGLIEMMGSANQVIASIVSFLAELHSAPRQRPRQAGDQLAAKFEDFFAQTQKESSAPAEAVPSGGVDDLLASYGL